MGFRYTSPPLTQGLTSLGFVAAGIGLMHLPGADAAWAAWLDWAPPWLQVVGVFFVLHGLIFWGMAAFFGAVERTGKPAFIARHRIQSGSPPAASGRSPPVGLEPAVLAPLMLLLLWGALQLRGWASPAVLCRRRCSTSRCSPCAAVWFYASHRFLHRPWWMKWVHQVHHEFRTTSCPLEYAHPFEVRGELRQLGWVVLVAPIRHHYYTILATVTFVGHHSGYAVP